MESGSSFIAKTAFFNGHNYPIWSVKMKAYLRAFNLWKVVETDQQPPPLRQNPTLAQIKQHTEEVTKRYKALTCIHFAVTDEIFDRIMRCETAKEAWDLLKVEFQGDSKGIQMQVLNLKREFAILRMNESETVKEFSDKIMKIVNRIRLLGDEELSDKRVVEKVLVSLPEKFEHKISSLEDSKDLSKIPLTELINSLQAVEQRKALRSQSNVEGALLATEKAEYTSHRFQQFLQQHGIHHQLTIPYTPQQNGVSERKNRSILNMARCLLFEKNLPKNFWAEAVYTAVHLQNRLPTKAIEGTTPFEAWSGNKPVVDHLKVFGCICYVFIPDEKRGKLDERANTCVFIGYSLQSKGYRVFNLKTQKIEVCRSAKFDESAAWDWEKSQVTNSDQVAKLHDKPELEVDFDDAANESDLIDDAPVRGTRTLEDIYSRCTLSTVEPSNYYEATNSDAWRAAMKEELKMIEKNDTWTLQDMKLSDCCWLLQHTEAGVSSILMSNQHF
ncbi:hypothetical protein SLEP1_g13839 [Rubroshorea leprosula]|uniref:Integrase catalytic domain-containing protein n=1 Tax=Rubroshorea leprosula TaxID=152421 RepID=A0AAV5ISM8_9ROSI|nr:hypothetical protein SLEP1_g13839 [Rubroshorea leprosula]